MSLSVVFRADASLNIGSGHVMRCLALANALAEAGARCRFVCRDLPGHLAKRVEDSGFQVDLLPTASSAPADAGRGNQLDSAWLPVGQDEDARQTAEALAGVAPDWIVVDHYALDTRWERALRSLAPRIMVIDDLADRPHLADLLLDQTLGRTPSEYDGLVGEDCLRLTGPSHALLRPEFAAARRESLRRRHEGHLAHVLVAMGGADKANVTGAVLSALDGLADDIRLTVAMGGQSPALAAVEAQAAAMPVPAGVVVDTPAMATIMADADLAIGAGGTTSWERCCVGLPALLLVLAENQRESAAALARAGACRVLGRWNEPGWQTELAAALAELRDSERLRRMSGAAAAICDGHGRKRVARAILATTPSLRPAGPDDTVRIWEWRHAFGAARFYRSGGATSFADHTRWFTAALADPARVLLVAEYRGEPVGHLRLDHVPDAAGTAELSICMAPEARGRGLARVCLEAGMMHARALGLRWTLAEVHAANTASIRLFEGASFDFKQREGDFITYERDASGD